MPLPRPPQSTALSVEDKKVRGWAITLTILLACLGIGWDVLFGLLLFAPNYSFFEGVVICLLVMLFCTTLSMRSDFELWSEIFRRSEPETDNAVDHRALDQLRTHLKAVFYAIAFLMALVKLVLLLIVAL